MLLLEKEIYEQDLLSHLYGSNGYNEILEYVQKFGYVLIKIMMVVILLFMSIVYKLY